MTDDILYPSGTLLELHNRLSAFKGDHLQARRLFCWDDKDTHNARMPENWRTLLIAKKKHYPVQIAKMNHPLLDMRFLTEEDRRYERLQGNFPHAAKSPPRLEEISLGS